MKINFNNSPAFKSLYISNDLSNDRDDINIAIRNITINTQLDYYISKCTLVENNEMKPVYRIENIGTTPGIGTTVRTVKFARNLEELKDYFGCKI